MPLRECPHCGSAVDDTLTQCPQCREDLPEIPRFRGYGYEAGRARIRRGLMYMWLSGIFYFFAAGYSGLQLPFEAPDALTEWLLPFMFLCGVGLVVYGIFQRFLG